MRVLTILSLLAPGGLFTACTAPRLAHVEVTPALRWVGTDSMGRHESMTRFRPCVVQQDRPFTLDFSVRDSFQSPDTLRRESILMGLRAHLTVTISNGVARVSGRCENDDHLGIVASYEQDDESLYAHLIRKFSTRFRGTSTLGHELRIGTGEDVNNEVSLCVTFRETSARPTRFKAVSLEESQ